MKLLRRLFSRILELLTLIYQVIKRILLEIHKWYDLLIFAAVLYGMIEINDRFTGKMFPGN